MAAGFATWAWAAESVDPIGRQSAVARTASINGLQDVKGLKFKGLRGV